VFRGVVQNNSPTAIVRADYRFASRAFVGSRLLNNRSAGDAQVDVYAGLARSLVLFDLIPVGVDGGVNVSVYTGGSRRPATARPRLGGSLGRCRFRPGALHHRLRAGLFRHRCHQLAGRRTAATADRRRASTPPPCSAGTMATASADTPPDAAEPRPMPITAWC